MRVVFNHLLVSSGIMSLCFISAAQASDLVCETSEFQNFSDFPYRPYHYFGLSTAVDGDTAVVGAMDDAYVYERHGLEWVKKLKLSPLNRSQDSSFGHSVAIHGDIIAVSARTDSEVGNHAGAVYLFYKNAGGDGRWGQVAKLTASDAAPVDVFGTSVSMDATRVVIGAPGKMVQGVWSAGAVYVFKKNSTLPLRWELIQKLTADEPGSGAWFGLSVDIRDDIIAVGAKRHPLTIKGHTYFAHGAAYVFRESVENLWRQEAQLVSQSGDHHNGKLFGASIHIGSRRQIAVGAPGDDYACPGNTDCYSGAVYVFGLAKNGWQQQIKILPSGGKDSVKNQNFGQRVAFEKDTLVVTASGEPFYVLHNPNPIDYAGAVYVFKTNSNRTRWHQELKLHSSNPQPGAYFGTAIGFSNDTLIVGAAYNSITDGWFYPDAGMAYAYHDLRCSCIPDFTGDGLVDRSDLSFIVNNQGYCMQNTCKNDLNKDWLIDRTDMRILANYRGSCQ